MSYLSEASTWRRQRRRRQRVTMMIVVVLVVLIGVAAFGYRDGWFGDPADDVAVTTLPPCPPATPTALTAADVHVNVYNSTPRNGLAAKVADSLGKRSFVIEAVANDPLHADVPGTALVRYGSAGAEAAKLVRAQVPKATMRHDKRKGTDVDLVLGDAFRRLAPATPPTTPLTPTASASCTPAHTPTSGTTSGTTTGTATTSATS